AYADCDLLVARGSLPAAGAALARLGFEPAAEDVSEHAHPWIREDGATVDLHATIWGPSRTSDFVWRELQGWTAPFPLGPVTARALSLPARALHVALHAAQHRERPRNPADLQRAIERCSLSDWREAERLADRLWALLELAQGLSLEPAGERLLEELPLARAALVAETADAPLAVGFARLGQARGIRAKGAVLATAVRGEREGRRGYMRRVAWLLGSAPRTLWRARTAGRLSRGSGPRR
ncbi:MAG TPA: nucleotidyltransferase family protein, partial [Solirubrobacteraceae bacterium]|nr:nucleotidyltransferase family protein [Solirubrobacteraceae bacterium]